MADALIGMILCIVPLLPAIILNIADGHAYKVYNLVGDLFDFTITILEGTKPGADMTITFSIFIPFIFPTILYILYLVLLLLLKAFLPFLKGVSSLIIRMVVEDEKSFLIFIGSLLIFSSRLFSILQKFFGIGL